MKSEACGEASRFPPSHLSDADFARTIAAPMCLRSLLALLCCLPLGVTGAERGVRANEPMVDLAEFAPRIVIELRYKGSRHLAKRPLYPAGARAYLRRSVAERLIEAQHWL